MPLITIQGARLTSEQKKRIGERIIDAFHREGIPANSVVVVVQRGALDLLFEDGFLVEAEPEPLAGPVAILPPGPAPVVASDPPVPEAAENFKTRARRTKAELVDLKARLIQKLQLQGALSSFQAQEELGLKDCDWAPATLRRFFTELEEEGVITKQGQKRGTRYVWKGITSHAPGDLAPRLVKRSGMGDDPEE